MGQTLVAASTEPIAFRLTLSGTTTPATGKTPTVLVAKGDSGSFAAAAGSVVERGSGWYELQPTTADTGTVGALLLHATASGCYASDDLHWVVAAEGDAPLETGSAVALPFLLVLTADGTTAAPGLTPTVTVYTPAATTLTPSGVEVGGSGNGRGWYRATLTPAAAGPYELAAVATGAASAGYVFDIAQGVAPAGGPWAGWLAWRAGGAGSGPSAGSDWTVLCDICDRIIAATGEPDVRPWAPEENPEAADSGMVIWVDLIRAPEDRTIHPWQTAHRGMYRVTVEADGDSRARIERLIRTGDVIRNALIDQPLGGICMPKWGELGEWASQPARHPRRRVAMDGAYVFAFSDAGGRDTTVREQD
jgi:hypothetical protein